MYASACCSLIPIIISGVETKVMKFAFSAFNKNRSHLGSLEQLKVPVRMPNLETFWTIFPQLALVSNGSRSFAITYGGEKKLETEKAAFKSNHDQLFVLSFLHITYS